MPIGGSQASFVQPSKVNTCADIMPLVEVPDIPSSLPKSVLETRANHLWYLRRKPLVSVRFSRWFYP